VTPFFKRVKNSWVDLNHNDLRTLYLSACPSPSSSTVIRKSSIVSGWDERMNIGDDWALYLDIILSKKCKVSFTLDKLWRKRLDSLNIYDGRKRSEVLRLLYIEDIKRIINRHKDRLSHKEIRILRKTQMYSLV